MAYKVLMKMPSVSFNTQIQKKCPDLTLGHTEGLLFPSMSADPLLRITQLEQNLRFLQEQHQIMLMSLHQEIEQLRQRNRDLQFQLVFSKGGITIAHSGSDSSSPDDDSKPKLILSPKMLNTRPLQTEMLEREVIELKAALKEANTNNEALNTLLDQHKKQLEVTRTSDSQVKDFECRLEDAEKLIRRLRKENEDQRKEITSLRSHSFKGNSNVSRHPSGGRRGGGGGQQERFPPLHSQSYWHQSQQGHTRNSPDFPSQSNGGQRKGMERTEIVGQAAQTLPHLNRYGQPSGSNNRARYYSNGNHYNNYRSDGEGGRKYRGGRGNRESSQ
uniref:CCDC92/74 N-terminal domain-containing protein n=1 Tax=Clastoptera arizonana TaxID=38151 RepID=A0A1B6CQA5_9HEMI